ncbi:hypothetical protein SLS60_008333 [Paraconiothyrium brasiliense]|uniref:Potassium channel tetramerisation-type BTB domain-containing protein n=1 Tax=Paraconiothyrium brasiliense TaxID=300254 RepID=A0ABR3R0A2_9PLEO
MAHQEEQGGADLDLSSLQLNSAGPSNTILDDPIPSIITLNVGGRHFRTYKSTLQDAGYFAPYLEGRWEWPKEKDGSFFCDADPDIFAHVLRYLRRPSGYPLFWTKANGFDYDLYHRLEGAAIDFQIKDLENWIKNKTYLKAITMEATTSARKVGTYWPKGEVKQSGDVNIDCIVVPRTEKVYVCPRDMPAHRGRPEGCSHACHKVRNGGPHRYEDQAYNEVSTICKAYFVDKKWCMREL